VNISVVVPVYKSKETLDELVLEVENNLKKIGNHYEIILVNDACPDNSWVKIVEICDKNKHVVGINLSRNFGQHYAISAGLKESKGEWVVVMDGDLQDVPSEIPNLFNKTAEGFDIVQAKRTNRQDAFLKIIYSKLFYLFLSFMTDRNYDSSVANFGIYSRKVIDMINSMPEKFRIFPIMVSWIGFNSISIPVKHSSRKAGKSSYNFKKLRRLALDIVLSYSDKPLRLTVKFGLLVSSFSFIYLCVLIYQYFTGVITVMGYTSIIGSITFFSGIIILVLGVIGLYIGKIFETVKQRPIYIISERIN
jgi:polyisoprenyl-phosphate glycosyltransferase